MPKPWSDKEVEAIVADYFAMLALELQGTPYNKTEHRRLLISQLDNRSHGSIERKHQNISAVLIESGMPFISGYKPLRNYQRAVLPDAVFGCLEAGPDINELMMTDSEKVLGSVPSVENILDILVNLPDATPPISHKNTKPFTYKKRKPVNYLAREAAHIWLGNAGENFVMNFEKARLIAKGKQNFADQIEHVSFTQGN